MVQMVMMWEERSQECADPRWRKGRVNIYITEGKLECGRKVGDPRLKGRGRGISAEEKNEERGMVAKEKDMGWGWGRMKGRMGETSESVRGVG